MGAEIERTALWKGFEQLPHFECIEDKGKTFGFKKNNLKTNIL